MFADGRRYAGRFMTLWVRTAAGLHARVGVAAGVRNGKAATRTRARRLMREAYRLNRLLFNDKFDVILSARQAISGAKRQDVESELLALAEKAGMLTRK